MTLSLTLSNALSGLAVAQRAIAVTAHNVANANTTGYTRKTAEQETRIVAGQGQGVGAAALSRNVDAYLVQELRKQASRLGASDAVARYHGRVQDLFGTPGDQRGINGALARLAAALETLQTSPETAAVAHDAALAAADLAFRLSETARQIQGLRKDADAEIARAVAQLNDELQALHGLNTEIARQSAAGQSAPDLEDRRDALLESLAEKIDIHVYPMGNGRLAVATLGGTALLDAQPRLVTYTPAGFVTADTIFGAIRAYPPPEVDALTGKPLPGAQGVVLVSSGMRAELTPELEADAIDDALQRVDSTLRSGRLAGLLEVRDRLLPSLDDQIQELATVTRLALNAAHGEATAHPPPARLEGSRTDLASYAAATRAGTAYLAVVDPASGATLQTVAVDLAAAATPAALAAQIDLALGGWGSAALAADGRLVIATSDPSHGLALARGDGAITVSDAAGRSFAYGLADYFGLNDLLVLTGPRPSDLALRPDLADDPSRFATARLEVAPGPPPLAALGGRGDNRGAQGLAAALSGTHDFLARGGLPAQRGTLAGYAADLVAHAAARAAQADGARERDEAMIGDLLLRQGAVSGVSIDEEMAQLIVYQRAYLASARLITLADELFQALMNIRR